MPKAIDLLREGKDKELWQMCCGFLSLNINDFMDIQNRLMVEQLELLSRCKLGEKIMRGARPATLEEFRNMVPLTTYKDYCPELLERSENGLPSTPALWVHSSGWSGEFPFKWVPMSDDYALELSKVLYGVGMLSCASDWGDTSKIPGKIDILYAVAPMPYISGTFADLLKRQTPLHYMPSIEESEKLSFEERIQLGFKQGVSHGIDYFFGLSLVLARVGDRIAEISNKTDLRPFLRSPRALWRLAGGKLKSRIKRRPMLPRDIWSLKGIIGSGVDSLVFKNKIKELWGRYPLDLYSCTEAGVIATQTWNYDGMTFVPNLNLLEFIPEEEYLKWQLDRSYKMKTLLLDEVKAGENYEIVITNFHGGSLLRYRIGDMVRITALSDDKLGIKLPQMTFERRVDDYIDFYVTMLTEKSIWQAIESTGVAYEDWVAYRDAENLTLNIGIELKEGYGADRERLSSAIYQKLVHQDNRAPVAQLSNQLDDMADIGLRVDILPKGTFAAYIARRQAEGADLAHLKPPHINPPGKILSVLTAEAEETIIVTRSGTRVKPKPGAEKVVVT